MAGKRIGSNEHPPGVREKRATLHTAILQGVSISKSELVCIMNLQPSERSDTYTVKIIYKISDISPKVWLIAPELQKVEGKRPHHIYEVDEQGRCRLCVYDPKLKEWNQQMFIADSFVP